MKKGKELKIDAFKNYSIVYGSINHKNPKAVYIAISAWALPKQELDFGYSRIIKDFNKKIRQSLFNYLSNIGSNFVSDRYIVDLDIRESGIKFGKRSYVYCEITLFLKDEMIMLSDEMKYVFNDLINQIIDSSFEKNRNFKFFKKKK